jgi:hypothetical protein
VQRTTPGTSGSNYNYFMVSGVVGGGRQDKNLSPTSLNTIPVYEITKAATKRAKSLLTTCKFVVRDRPRDVRVPSLRNKKSHSVLRQARGP